MIIRYMNMCQMLGCFSWFFLCDRHVRECERPTHPSVLLQIGMSFDPPTIYESTVLSCTYRGVPNCSTCMKSRIDMFSREAIAEVCGEKALSRVRMIAVVPELRTKLVASRLEIQACCEVPLCVSFMHCVRLIAWIGDMRSRGTCARSLTRQAGKSFLQPVRVSLGNMAGACVSPSASSGSVGRCILCNAQLQACSSSVDAPLGAMPATPAKGGQLGIVAPVGRTDWGNARAVAGTVAGSNAAVAAHEEATATAAVLCHQARNPQEKVSQEGGQEQRA